MTAITYALTPTYYDDVARLTDRTLTEADRLLPSVQPFIEFLMHRQIESPRAATQYQLELMMIGVYWRNYRGFANAVSRRTVELCHGLLSARKEQRYKAFVDELRGIIHTKTLRKKDENAPFQLTLEGLKKLHLWLSATGDFAEESNRIGTWLQYLSTHRASDANQYLRGAQSLAGWFIPNAQEALGDHTKNVNHFKRNVATQYANREDIILCDRSESDYHLIMVGAEVMNRALRTEFEKTQKQIVLLPACMRPVDHRCKAVGTDADLTCCACHSSCAIGQIKQQGGKQLDVRVIVHATNFTEILKKWENQKQVGLVASACVLHLFMGGLEMQKLNIPSQCVLLEFSGCKNHWHPTGISTALSTQQLFRVLPQSPTPAMPLSASKPFRYLSAGG
ncbi:MAG: DUF116 domain-containing protein [Deltaproteobacteria bacterium]|nr:DUF116 domain-containing protein [Deltaproteobacteria bacterium]MBN2672322.1 DUF116 domain-containing protein [Deltaproteobacteria bacterium]